MLNGVWSETAALLAVRSPSARLIGMTTRADMVAQLNLRHRRRGLRTLFVFRTSGKARKEQANRLTPVAGNVRESMLILTKSVNIYDE